MPFQTSSWITSDTSPQASQQPSGAASVRHTPSSWWKALSTSSQQRQKKIPWSIASPCSRTCHGRGPYFSWRRRSQVGAKTCRIARVGVHPFKVCSEHSWRRSHRSMSLTRVKSMSSAWSARSTAGSPLIPTRSRTQIQGAIIYGLTAALHGEITLKNGRVEQSNFDNYRALYINEVPSIDVHIVDRDEA